MILYFHLKLDELHLDEFQAFEVAYQWFFKPPRVPDMANTYCRWKIDGIWPPFLIEWIKHLQSQETRPLTAVETVPETK